MTFARLMLTGAALGCAVLAQAQDHADVDRTQIIGNRELPKVLYIVPWKKPLPGDLAGRPLISVLDEVLAPVDRDVFRRQLQYAALTKAQTTAAATLPATPATTATPTAPTTPTTVK
jgi:hypothetical protein